MGLNRQYLTLLRRWAWLWLFAAALAAASAYWVSQQQPTVYEAKAQLVVGPGIDSPNPDLNSLRAGAQLMQTYTKLATTRPILEAVIADLRLSTTPELLIRHIAIASNEGAQILTITVSDGDPMQAAAIANALADTLVRISPTGTDDAEATRLKAQVERDVEEIEAFIDSTQARIEQLEAELQAISDSEADAIVQVVITTTQARIEQLEAQLQTTTDPETQRLILDQIAVERNRLFEAQRVGVDQRRLILDQLSQERGRLSEAQRTLAMLRTSLQSAYTNQVKIVEPAIAGVPADSMTQLRIAIAALAGLISALAITLVFEYLNDTVDAGDESGQRLDTPVVGAISAHEPLPKSAASRLVVQALPASAAAEDYRVLGTKLFFAAGNSARSIMISRPDEGGDTGEIVANLGATVAQTGSTVILVDADVHRPALAELFGIPNSPGLMEALASPATRPEAAPVASIPGLSVLPAGEIGSNPFELLASPRMERLIRAFEERADVVIVSTPPLLSYAASLIMASRVEGVILVAQNNKTRREMIRRAVAQLQSLGATIVGTVVNDVTPRRRRLVFRRVVRRSVREQGNESQSRQRYNESEPTPLPSVQAADS